jgi:hypothetical protein
MAAAGEHVAAAEHARPRRARASLDLATNIEKAQPAVRGAAFAKERTWPRSPSFTKLRSR